MQQVNQQSNPKQQQPSFQTNNQNLFLQFIWQTYFQSIENVSPQKKMQHFRQLTHTQLPKSSQQKEIANLQKENSHLRAQLSSLKIQKNSCEQRIIHLSNNIYELQRALMTGNEGILQEDGNCTLDQFSAISIDRYEQPQRNNCPLFTKRTIFNLEINDCDALSEDNSQLQELQSLNLNFLGRGRHPLKQSLQVGYGDNVEHNHFVQEMKRMKVKAQRMAHLDSMDNRQKRRNTFGPLTERTTLAPNTNNNPNRRFKRIRA